MINFKACPRCKGDTHIRQDIYGDYIECLQCGYMEDLAKQPSASRIGMGQQKKADKKRQAA